MGERVLAGTRFNGQAEPVTVRENMVYKLPSGFPSRRVQPSPIDYRSQDFVEEVRRLTRGEGIDLAFDALGPSSFRKDYQLLRQGAG